MSRKSLTVLVPIVLVALLVGIVAYAVAQAPGGGFGGGGAQPGQGMRGGFGGFRGFGGGGPAIAVADGAVFIVMANRLYKYDANTLELLAQAEIPVPQPPAPPATPGQ